MTTSISSEALTDRWTKYLQNRCLYLRGNYTEDIKHLSKLATEIIVFPLKVVIISNYRVASLLIILEKKKKTTAFRTFPSLQPIFFLQYKFCKNLLIHFLHSQGTFRNIGKQMLSWIDGQIDILMNRQIDEQMDGNVERT